MQKNVQFYDKGTMTITLIILNCGQYGKCFNPLYMPFTEKYLFSGIKFREHVLCHLLNMLLINQPMYNISMVP